jgi:hypothetical protein
VSGRAVWSVLRLRFTALSNKDPNPKKTGQAMNAVACSELAELLSGTGAKIHGYMRKLFCRMILLAGFATLKKTRFCLFEWVF